MRPPMPSPSPSPVRPAGGLPPAARREPRDPYIGTVLNNRFKIEAKLGEGGFGAVYRGTQVGIGRKVAVKLLHPEMARDQNLVARFRREGQVACSLRDAHTITTYDFDQTPDGTLYIAMELLEGRSLHSIFHDESPVAWPRMFKIVAEMCSSLHEAHTQGIVHRDLKPENVYLENRPGNSEFVKILDFGIAKIVRGDGTGGNQAPQLTATGQTLGTLEYMSPEQLMGKELDGRSDIYAIGVVTYELVTGRLPFPDAVGPAALISAQLRRTPDPPSRALATAGIPEGVDRVVLKSLEKDRNKRFRDVEELRVACEQVLASGGRTPALAGGSNVDVVPPQPGLPQVPETLVRPGSRPGLPSSPQPPPLQQAHASSPQFSPVGQDPLMSSAPHLPSTLVAGEPRRPSWSPHYGFHAGMAEDSTQPTARAKTSSSRLWLWLALAIVVLGGSVGAILALR